MVRSDFDTRARSIVRLVLQMNSSGLTYGQMINAVADYEEELFRTGNVEAADHKIRKSSNYYGQWKPPVQGPHLYEDTIPF